MTKLVVAEAQRANRGGRIATTYYTETVDLGQDASLRIAGNYSFGLLTVQVKTVPNDVLIVITASINSNVASFAFVSNSYAA